MLLKIKKKAFRSVFMPLVICTCLIENSIETHTSKWMVTKFRCQLANPQFLFCKVNIMSYQLYSLVWNSCCWRSLSVNIQWNLKVYMCYLLVLWFASKNLWRISCTFIMWLDICILKAINMINGDLILWFRFALEVKSPGVTSVQYDVLKVSKQRLGNVASVGAEPWKGHDEALKPCWKKPSLSNYKLNLNWDL